MLQTRPWVPWVKWFLAKPFGEEKLQEELVNEGEEEEGEEKVSADWRRFEWGKSIVFGDVRPCSFFFVCVCVRGIDFYFVIKSLQSLLTSIFFDVRYEAEF